VPDDGAAWERRAFAYRSQKKFKEAIADYTKAIATDPKDPDGYRRRAQAHIMAGDSVKAAEDFKAILKIKPDDVDAQSRLKALETRANASPSPATPAPATSPAKAPSMAPPAASPH
jgi:tetratricopeptide (TPR) repeat protein